MKTSPADIVSDPVGFPMVWREEVGGYVHWLPVTKIQFEYFLCDAPDAHFNDRWYEEILDLNPRVSPTALSGHSYWGALMTGLQPSEVQRFSYWCGDEFRIATESEWLALYRGLRTEPRQNCSTSGLLEGCSFRVRQLLERMEEISLRVCQRMGGTPSLADQMLLRFGALEWLQVGSPPSSWGLKGEPLPEFCGNLESLEGPAINVLPDQESSRFRAAGFRLLYFPSPGQERKADPIPPAPNESEFNGG